VAEGGYELERGGAQFQCHLIGQKKEEEQPITEKRKEKKRKLPKNRGKSGCSISHVVSLFNAGEKKKKEGEDSGAKKRTFIRGGRTSRRERGTKLANTMLYLVGGKRTAHILFASKEEKRRRKKKRTLIPWRQKGKRRAKRETSDSNFGPGKKKEVAANQHQEKGKRREGEEDTNNKAAQHSLPPLKGGGAIAPVYWNEGGGERKRGTIENPEKTRRGTLLTGLPLRRERKKKSFLAEGGRK